MCFPDSLGLCARVVAFKGAEAALKLVFKWQDLDLLIKSRCIRRFYENHSGPSQEEQCTLFTKTVQRMDVWLAHPHELGPRLGRSAAWPSAFAGSRCVTGSN